MKTRDVTITCAAVVALFSSTAISWADNPTIIAGLQFVGGQAHINDKLLGKVWAIDPATHVKRTIVEIKADAGPQWDRVTRAKTVATRLQSEYQKNPTFYTKLFRDSAKNSDIVLTTDHQGQWIVTADDASARLNNQGPDEYANAIKSVIQKVLSDPSVRDAPFDYQLTTPEQKRERAEMYRHMGDDEFADDKSVADLKRAEDLYKHALNLLNNDSTIELRLASAYLKDGNKVEARKCFDLIDKSTLDNEDQSSYDTMKAQL